MSSCDLVSCAESERCREGVCEPNPCFGVDCGAEARCVEGACVANGINDASSDGMDSGARRDAGRRGAGASDGCGCRAAGARTSSRAGWLALGALALVLARRRRASSWSIG